MSAVRLPGASGGSQSPYPGPRPHVTGSEQVRIRPRFATIPRVILADGFVGLALLALFVFCVIDVLTTPEHEVRNLPKLGWLLIVIVLPLVGSVAWLVAGRRQGPSQREYRSTTPARAYPEYDRPNRAVPSRPDDDEAFLAQVRARAEAQRRDYDLRRRAEQAEEENRQRGLRDDPE